MVEASLEFLTVHGGGKCTVEASLESLNVRGGQFRTPDRAQWSQVQDLV